MLILIDAAFAQMTYIRDKPFKLTKKSGGDDQLPLAHT